jgi:alpha-L-fucosidase
VEEGQFADQKSREFTSEDIRFTCNGGDVYATVMRCPADGVVRIRSLRKADARSKPLWHGIIRRVEVLGMGEASWQRDEEALTVQLGSFRSDMPVVVKVITD